MSVVFEFVITQACVWRTTGKFSSFSRRMSSWKNCSAKLSTSYRPYCPYPCVFRYKRGILFTKLTQSLFALNIVKFLKLVLFSLLYPLHVEFTHNSWQVKYQLSRFPWLKLWTRLNCGVDAQSDNHHAHDVLWHAIGLVALQNNAVYIHEGLRKKGCNC